MFQATRRRLAIWYICVTALILLLFASGVYLYFRNTLIERLDDTLYHIAEVVERSLVIEKDTKGIYSVNLEGSFRNTPQVVDEDHIDLEWFSPQGKLMWSTFTQIPNIPLSFYNQTVYVSTEHLLRQVTQRLEFGRQVLGYLRVSHPWFEVTKPSRLLLRDLTIGIILMLSCVGAIGWLLSGIAIQPVKDSYQNLKQFTADVSHELRNPIAMIQTNVQTALAYPEVQQPQLLVVERLTRRLAHLVNDLLFLTRSDNGMVEVIPQPVPLDALLMQVLEEQRLFSEEKQILLSLDIPTEDNFTMLGDWEQLACLFTNLISNAIRYTNNYEHQGKVTIQLHAIMKERHSYLQVKVKDNGIGITPEALPHIFDRFYRVDPYSTHVRDNLTSSGAGLGLAIAQTIVKNHQGHITVESIQGNPRGTTFTVTFPAT